MELEHQDFKCQMNEKDLFIKGIKDCVPTIFGYLSIGIACGILCKSCNITFWQAIGMSTFIYAGSAQFISAGMMFSGIPAISIIFTIFFVNLRHVFMSVAMAILNFPKLLILDEPTNGLDPSGIHEIRELIKSFPKEYDMTVIISSHLLNEIDMIATQVGIITEGKLVFQDKLEKLHEKGEASILLKSDNLNKAQNILNMNGFSSKIKDDYLVLGDIKDNVVSRINSFLVKSGVNIYRIEKNRKTLEEIFMELTGKESTL